MSNPIGKGNPPTRVQNSESLSKRSRLIGHMEKGLLTYNCIHAPIRKGDFHNIVFNDANGVL